MVRVFSQNIPGYLASAYISDLQPSTSYLPGSLYGISIYGLAKYGIASLSYVRERYPFRLPHMQGGV